MSAAAVQARVVGALAARALVIQTRKALEEHGGKVSPETRGKIESAISNLEGKLKADDTAALEAAMKELENASMELGKAVYEASKNAGPAPGAGRPRACPVAGPGPARSGVFWPPLSG